MDIRSGIATSFPIYAVRPFGPVTKAGDPQAPAPQGGQAQPPPGASISPFEVVASLTQALGRLWDLVARLLRNISGAPQAVVTPAVYVPGGPAAVPVAPAPTPPPAPPPPPPAPVVVPPSATAAVAAQSFFSDRATPQYKVYGGTEALWLGGSTEAQTYLRWILQDAQKRGETPVVVQYAIPGRDRGGPSAGGATTLADYLAGVESNAGVIGQAPAVLVIEPDALTLGLSVQAIKGAVAIYKRLCPNARVYIDAGHSAWASVDDITNKLLQAGIETADGFALNTSAFEWTNNNLAYGDKIVAALAARNPALADKQFVIDTSRNGNGPGVDDQGKWTWGDPVRAQNGGPVMNGPLPTTNTGDSHCAAFLWVKGAGKGDNRTRPAGQFGGADWVQPTRSPRLGP